MDKSHENIYQKSKFQQILERLQVDELGVATEWTYCIAESAAFAV